MKPTFYEFFAGGGMARAGLEPDWKCLFANDCDAKKAESYIANWGGREFKPGDVYDLRVSDIPGKADLAWASFPCQDLSLAGNGAGLDAERSGAFWGFHRTIQRLARAGRAPKTLVLENVVGILTSNHGQDFEAICSALNDLGYSYGALILDAVHFVPQSRPRFFVVATWGQTESPHFTSDRPVDWIASAALLKAYARLPDHLRRYWRWWRLPNPPHGKVKLSGFVERSGDDLRWHSASQTERLLALMAPRHLEKLCRARARRGRVVGTVYRRMRRSQTGEMVQRAELRLDNIAGCLRTPVGGSSRQIVLVIERGELRTRLLSTREAARLMGLPHSYKLPKAYNDAYHLIGDGVAVPVVQFLSSKLLLPLVESRARPVRLRDKRTRLQTA